MIDKVNSALMVLRQMSKGKTLTLPKSGNTIGMTENGFVGFVTNGSVSLFSEITFSQLANICEEENIIVIPK